MIWKGDKLIQGVPETLQLLRSKALGRRPTNLFLSLPDSDIDHMLIIYLIINQGKKLVFVTNNSTKSRKQYANKFLSLGISVTEVFL